MNHLKSLMTYFSVIILAYLTSRLLEYDTFLYAWITLPGTALHEAFHFLMAVLLNGHPSSISIIPTPLYIDDDLIGIMLGNVLYKPNSYNTVAVGLAPLLMLPAVVFFVHACVKTKSKSLSLSMFYFYVIVCLFAGCEPSSIDIDGMSKDIVSQVLGFGIIGLGMIVVLVLSIMGISKYNHVGENTFMGNSSPN